MIIDKLIQLINETQPKEIILSEGEYIEMMQFTCKRTSVFFGCSGWDEEKDCYMFAGVEIRRVA